MAPESRDEGPQRDEVRQRINSLYDQAENATGNYNATRAMASVTRSRGVPLAKRSGRRPDPALDEVARPWFDGARAKLGPTVPAVLPADRLPDRPAAPGRSRGRAGGSLLPDGGPDALGTGPSARRLALEGAADRAVAELTAGPAPDAARRALAALESGRAALPGPRRPELPGAGGESIGLVPAGAGGASAPERALPDSTALLGTPGVPAGLETARPVPGFPDLGVVEPADPGPVETAVLPATGLFTTPGAPAQEPWPLPGPTAPGRPSPAASKTNNQRKLAAASDVISRYAARLVAATAVPPASPPTAVGTPPSTSAAAAPPAPLTTAPSGAVAATPPMPLTPEPSASVSPAPPDPLAFGPVTTAQPVTVAPPTPVVPAAPAPLPSDPATGQWQQPQWASPGEAVTAMPAGDAWSAAGSSVTGTGPLTSLPESPRAVRAARAIAFARAQIGKPCVWGATGPDSYDCSSLTQAAWKAAGVTLPRAAHQQALAGTPVTLDGLEPGDLVLFFDDDRHVGLHVGGGMMVHAPGPGASIREESIYGAGESAIHRIVRPS